MGELGRPDWLDTAASGELGRLGPLARSPSSAKSRATRPPGRARQAIVDDLGSILASVFDVFRSFLTCHGTGDSTRCAQGRTFVFAGRRSTLEGSQARQKHAKSRKLDRSLLGRRFASELRARSSPFSIPCASQPRFSSPRRAPRRSKAVLLEPRGDLGDPFGLLGCAGDAPRRSRDALGTASGSF